MTDHAVPKPHFAKQFWITTGVMDFHAMVTPHKASTVFHYLMSSAGTFLSLSCNSILLVTGGVWSNSHVAGSTLIH
jgi:hypothetical protein